MTGDIWAMGEQGDATKQALAQIELSGSDLSLPLLMDFFVAVPSRANGQAIAERVSRLGFETSVKQDPETGSWTCYCSKELVPTFEAVTAIERELNGVASDMGGYADGFGTFGNGGDAAD